MKVIQTSFILKRACLPEYHINRINPKPPAGMRRKFDNFALLRRGKPRERRKRRRLLRTTPKTIETFKLLPTNKFNERTERTESVLVCGIAQQCRTRNRRDVPKSPRGDEQTQMCFVSRQTEKEKNDKNHCKIKKK